MTREPLGTWLSAATSGLSRSRGPRYALLFVAQFTAFEILTGLMAGGKEVAPAAPEPM